MTKEEKKAIYSFNEWIEISEKGRLDYFRIIDKDIEDMKTVLNLIQNLQEENKKYKYLYQKALDNTIQSDRENIRKDNIIDKISQNPFNELRVDGIRFCGTDIKQYFEKKVSDGDE